MKNIKRPSKRRTIVSMLLFVSFIILFFSALIAHAAESATVRHAWLHVHGYSGLIFTVLMIFHTVYNWRSLKRYFIGK
jgi:hypothetical protein